MKIPIEYLAGFFDGEGCVGINSSDKGKRRRIEVQVSNTRVEILKEYKRLFGGYLYLANRNNKNKKWQNCFCWLIADKKAAAFLEKIIPFLILKKQEAILAVAYKNTPRISMIPNIKQMPQSTKNVVIQKNKEIENERERIYSEFKLQKKSQLNYN